MCKSLENSGGQWSGRGGSHHTSANRMCVCVVTLLGRGGMINVGLGLVGEH
jgi:hypothetical protein